MDEVRQEWKMPGLDARRSPLPREALQLRGFSADRAVFLLTTARNVAAAGATAAAAPVVLERDFADLQAWDRLLSRSKTVSLERDSSAQGKPKPADRSSFQRLPSRRLKKLMALSWVRGDVAAGWRIELQKNVAACETWINDAFTRLPAALQTTFLDNQLYTATKQKQAALRAEMQHAKNLQQYFTSPPLVEFIVEKVIAFAEEEEVGKREEVVWLEPSCGDGRVMTALLRHGARRVVGYEIDQRLHDVASLNVQQAKAAGSTLGLDVQVHCGDFLASTNALAKGQVVVAIGNPPFGAKGGDGSDLVHRFVQHSAHEWHASAIAFVVPERCSRPSFVEATLQLAGGSSEWELALEEPLAGFEFEFGGGEQHKRVKQPSVLQLFRAKLSDRTN